jgi:signal peptidase
VPIETLRVGDVIRFRQGSRDVVHRIVEIEMSPSTRSFLTRGDNNVANDPVVFANDVEGKLMVHVPKIGMPGIWAKQFVNAVTP